MYIGVGLNKSCSQQKVSQVDVNVSCFSETREKISSILITQHAFRTVGLYNLFVFDVLHRRSFSSLHLKITPI